MSLLTVRVDLDEYETWKAHAQRQGSSLSDWVRRTLTADVQGRDVNTMTGKIAQRVVHEVLPEIERVLMERPGASPTPSLPSAYVPQPGPRPWDPQCYSADLHRNGSVCNECGGSFQPKR